MKTHAFLSQVDHDQIHQAVQAAEHGTAGNLVIYISHRRVNDPVASAQRIFRKLRLETPTEKTGLLIFVAPLSHKFAVLGGTALHEKLGQPWWDRLAATITGHFKEERYTAGLLAAVHDAAHAFKTHFPSAHSRPPGEIDIYDR